jgi:hypothetical protein
LGAPTPGFVDGAVRELATSGLPPTCLILEITESLFARPMPAAAVPGWGLDDALTGAVRSGVGGR